MLFYSLKKSLDAAADDFSQHHICQSSAAAAHTNPNITKGGIHWEYGECMLKFWDTTSNITHKYGTILLLLFDATIEKILKLIQLDTITNTFSDIPHMQLPIILVSIPYLVSYFVRTSASQRLTLCRPTPWRTYPYQRLTLWTRIHWHTSPLQDQPLDAPLHFRTNQLMHLLTTEINPMETNPLTHLPTQRHAMETDTLPHLPTTESNSIECNTALKVMRSVLSMLSKVHNEKKITNLIWNITEVKMNGDKVIPENLVGVR